MTSQAKRIDPLYYNQKHWKLYFVHIYIPFYWHLTYYHTNANTRIINKKRLHKIVICGCHQLSFVNLRYEGFIMHGVYGDGSNGCLFDANGGEGGWDKRWEGDKRCSILVLALAIYSHPSFVFPYISLPTDVYLINTNSLWRSLTVVCSFLTRPAVDVAVNKIDIWRVRFHFSRDCLTIV